MSFKKILFFAIVFAAVGLLVFQFLKRGRNSYEGRWQVRDEDGEITCVDPKGKKNVVVWNDLVLVQMETNDRGPQEPDVFWILRDSKSSCRFPGGAIGEPELTKKLFAMPEFDLKLFSERAATSEKNRIFELWKKK